MCSRKISVFMCKSSVYFSALPPRFRLVPPHFVCSGDCTATVTMYLMTVPSFVTRLSCISLFSTITFHSPLLENPVCVCGSIHCCSCILPAVAGRRRNKARNAAGLSRTRSKDQFLYAKLQFILVPPPTFS